MTIYIDIVMSVIEEISKLLKNKCDDDVLLNYIYMKIMMNLNVN